MRNQDAARADEHAAASGDGDHAVGDLQAFFRAAFGLLTPARRRRSFDDPEVSDLAGLSEYAGLLDVPGQELTPPPPGKARRRGRPVPLARPALPVAQTAKFAEIPRVAPFCDLCEFCERDQRLTPKSSRPPRPRRAGRSGPARRLCKVYVLKDDLKHLWG
jgi:hypothetical protein